VEGVTKQEALEGLPQYIKEWLEGPGSTGDTGLIEYLAQRGVVEETTAGIFRAYIGDLYAVASGSEQNMFNLKFQDGCRDAHVKDALQKGELCRVPVGSKSCVCEEAQKIFNNISNAINQAYDSAFTGGNPSEEYDRIVKISPVPVYLFVKYAAVTKNRAFLASLAPDVARGMIYAGLLDLAKKMEAVVKVIDEIRSQGTGGSASGRELLGPIIEGRKNFVKKLKAFEADIRGLYLASLGEISKSVEQALVYARFMDILEKNLGTTLFSSAGAAAY